MKIFPINVHSECYFATKMKDTTKALNINTPFIKLSQLESSMLRAEKTYFQEKETGRLT